MPVGGKWLAENKMRNPHYFRQPGKRDNKREAEGFNPEDRIRFTLNLFHEFYCACAGTFCPEKVMPGSAPEQDAPGRTAGSGKSFESSRT